MQNDDDDGGKGEILKNEREKGHWVGVVNLSKEVESEGNAIKNNKFDIVVVGFKIKKKKNGKISWMSLCTNFHTFYVQSSITHKEKKEEKNRGGWGDTLLLKYI